MHNRKTHNFIYNTYNYGGLHEAHYMFCVCLFWAESNLSEAAAESVGEAITQAF